MDALIGSLKDDMGYPGIGLLAAETLGGGFRGSSHVEAVVEVGS